LPAVEPDPVATLFWMLVSGRRRLAGRVRSSRARLSDRVPRWPGIEADRRRKPGDAHRAGRPRRAGQLATLVQPDGQRAGRRRKKITQQTNEIMAVEPDAEKRVEDKSAELRQAQDLLLRSRSLSALGELGAGVATRSTTR
jgi:C4-dicarboxylate-specific signal transduction histidine kinase